MTQSVNQSTNKFKLQTPRWLKRFYRLRLSTGVLMSMPALLLVLWSVGAVDQSLTAFRKLSGETAALDPTLYQIALHDQLQHQLRAGSVSEISSAQAASASDAALPEFAFEIKNERLIEMLNTRRQPFVEGKLDYQGKRYKQTELRLRGNKHWHLLEAKKSLRVKLDKGKLINGLREFNLNNSNDPVIFDQKLISDLAHQLGLLTPEADFAKVSINGMLLGVYTLSTPVDEMILRRARQIPANIYSLDKLSADWRSSGRWEKISAYQNKDAAAVSGNDRSDLQRLITMLQVDKTGFAEFAKEELALKDFAALDALQLLFGHDDKQRSYNLTFDPYRGQWRPIVFKFEGFRSEQIIPNRDPLFVKLAELPEYLQLRSDLINQLLAQQASPEKIRRQGELLMHKLLPELSLDPNWKANKQLPALNGLYSQMMRPMSPERLELAFEAELETYARRIALLKPFLNAPEQRVAGVAASIKVPESVVLGPGRVQIPTTRVFNSETRVKILPGTDLVMGRGASLIFRGHVDFAGTDQAPIYITSDGSGRWGGLVLQGQQTAGSRLNYVYAFGGTHPTWRAFQYPGMINLHNSQNITLTGCRFGDNAGSDDLVHTVYVTDLKAENIWLEKAFSDAWDIEFSEGRLNKIVVVQAGDDGIDLMGSRLEMTNSALLAATHNGISAGEESRVQVSSSLIADTGVAALSKNASHLSFLRSLLYRNQSGLEIYQKASHYTGLSTIDAESLFAAGQQTPLILDEDSRRLPSLPSFETGYQTAHQLESLRQQLGLKSWSELPRWISQQRRAAR